MSRDVVVKVSGLTKQFGRFTALRSVSLDLSKGEFLTIFGRNGAGKTTLLKILSSIVRAYSGQAALFGDDVKRANEAVRRKIGFISHESFIYNDLTVYENLVFYARLYGIRDVRERVEALIKRVGLEAKTSVAARALSRGMRQRLSLARAVLHEPELLLLDEPYTGLDEQGCDILSGFLAEFAEGGGTILMTTHNIERGWKQADHVLVLERGAVVYRSPARDTTIEAFRERYRDILSH